MRFTTATFTALVAFTTLAMAHPAVERDSASPLDSLVSSSGAKSVDAKLAGQKLPLRRLASDLSAIDLSGLENSKIAGQKLPLMGRRDADADAGSDPLTEVFNKLVSVDSRDENPAAGIASALQSAPDQLSSALDGVNVKTAGQKLPVRRADAESPLQQTLEKQGKQTLEGLKEVNVNGKPLSDVLMQRLVARLVPGVADAKATGLDGAKVDGQKPPLADMLSQEKRLVPGIADAKATGLDDAKVDGQKLPLSDMLSQERRLVPGVADAKATGLDDASVDGQKLPVADMLSSSQEKRLVPGIADARATGLDGAKISGQKLPTDSLLKGARGLPTDALSPTHAISGLDSVKVNGKKLSPATQKSIMESLQQDLHSRLVDPATSLDPSSSSFDPENALSPVLTSGQDNGYGEGDSQQLGSKSSKRMVSRKRLLGGQHRHFELPPRQ